jgi:hypothetical protein
LLARLGSDRGQQQGGEAHHSGLFGSLAAPLLAICSFIIGANSRFRRLGVVAPGEPRGGISMTILVPRERWSESAQSEDSMQH